MYSWRKYILAVVAVATAAGFGYIKSSHRHIPADLRDAVADKVFDTSIPSFEKNSDNISEPKVEAVDGISKGYFAGNDPSVGAPDRPVEFISIPAGKFTMGADSGEKGLDDAQPIHEVTIKAFEMSKTEVTVEQYAECVSKKGCTAPTTSGYCNWGKPGRQFHPVNCVNWAQAQAYAKFKGARLPSEAEFEYAATSGGKNQKYPWGNDEPTRERAVFNVNRTMPACSKPTGNTEQGLCDMSGNVWEWVQDVYKDSYGGAPVDGSAFEGAGSFRVVRGGSFSYGGAGILRAASRGYYGPGFRYGNVGFRLARSSR